MKKKFLLTVLYIISLLPMLLNQYGGCKGVQEISGLINLWNPIGILAILLYALGVWLPLKYKVLNRLLGTAGVIGIVISELCTYFTWHVATITGKASLQNSMRLAFPEFYVGLLFSLSMVAAYFIIEKTCNT